MIFIAFEKASKPNLLLQNNWIKVREEAAKSSSIWIAICVKHLWVVNGGKKGNWIFAYFVFDVRWQVSDGFVVNEFSHASFFSLPFKVCANICLRSLVALEVGKTIQCISEVDEREKVCWNQFEWGVFVSEKDGRENWKDCSNRNFICVYEK